MQKWERLLSTTTCGLLRRSDFGVTVTICSRRQRRPAEGRAIRHDVFGLRHHAPIVVADHVILAAEGTMPAA